MTPSPEVVIEDMKGWQAKILRIIGRMIGIPGYAYITYITFNDEVEPTINDIIRNIQEDEANSVRTNKLTEMESGE